VECLWNERFLVMLKIVTNHNKQDVTYSFKIGQAFPEVEGKLLSIELNGKELQKFLEVRDIPVSEIDTAYITWQGKPAGSVLKALREIYA
jgi:hypothetical protein